MNDVEYDDYDRLIHLCDAVSLPTSFCILEVRLIDVAIRNGVNEYSIEKWKKFHELKSNIIAVPVCCEIDLADGFCNNKCRHCFFGTNTYG